MPDDEIPTILAPISAKFVVPPTFDREKVDRQLINLALQRTAFEKADESERHLEAWRLVSMAMHMAASVIGHDALDLFYGSAEGLDRQSQLQRLAERLRPLLPLYGASRQVSGDPAGLMALFEEIDAVQHGDAPRLFARFESMAVQGQATNRRRMAKHKLRALEWGAYLAGRDVDAADRLHALHKAFHHEWAVIKQWRGQIVPMLGEDFVARHIKWARAGLGFLDKEWTEAEWREQIAYDGEAFNRERWKGAPR